MIRKTIIFVIRWLLNSLGLWVAVRLLGSGYGSTEASMSIVTFLLGGLVFSIINAILKPLLVVLSLPFIVLTLGIFMFIINGVLVYISMKITPGLSMSFLNSILTGLILSLINYIVSAAIEIRAEKRRSQYVN